MAPPRLATIWARLRQRAPDAGQGMAEYAIILVAVAVVVVVGLFAIGPKVAAMFNSAGASLSDRNKKAQFAKVNIREVLGRVEALPIATWNYPGQGPAVRHLGPMAQDFRAAFGVGEDDTHINPVDANGVTLAAIQGLYQLVQEQERQLTGLAARLATLEARELTPA
jgi:Flp pilus assembly pilin Flp